MSDDRGVSVVPAPVPVWHPAALVALIVLVSGAGGVLAARHVAPVSLHGSLVVRAYVPLLLVSWGLLLYVCRVGRPRFVFRALAVAGDYTTSRALIDLLLAGCAVSALIAGELAWQSAFGTARSAAAAALLPSSPLERAVWCVVALSAGVSEELVYRGYLASQLTRLTASRAAGVLGQALLFALAHGEQGGGAMLRFFLYAVGLGVLARVRRSLLPGMLAHAGVDLLAGLAP